jgi:hypothetical protein
MVMEKKSDVKEYIFIFIRNKVNLTIRIKTKVKWEAK